MGTPHEPYTDILRISAYTRYAVCYTRYANIFIAVLPFALALYEDTKGANIVTGVKVDILPEWKITAPDETGEFEHRSITNA